MNCVKLQVPQDACHIVFKHESYDHSLMTEYRTILGDQVILEFNSQDQLIGIELLGSKPCQVT